MKYCKICKKPANEVTIIHKVIEGSSFQSGYCLKCQEWIFMGFLVWLMGFVGVIFGVLDWDFVTFGVGVLMLLIGFTFPGIVSLFYRRG